MLPIKRPPPPRPQPPWRMLVCGDRDYQNANLINNFISAFHRDEIEVIIQGMAPGADTIARNVASRRELPYLDFPADWDRYKRAAGPIRNKQMLDEGKPNIGVGFHDNFEVSKGTRNMWGQVTAAGLPFLLLGVERDARRVRMRLWYRGHTGEYFIWEKAYHAAVDQGGVLLEGMNRLLEAVPT